MEHSFLSFFAFLFVTKQWIFIKYEYFVEANNSTVNRILMLIYLRNIIIIWKYNRSGNLNLQHNLKVVSEELRV
jgi:hypothetical protein